MSELKNLEDLFHHQLKDLYSAESQLIDALPKMKKEASNKKLQEAFSDHLKETKEHKKRLEKIAKKLDIDPSGETCKAMKGLIKEAKSFIKESKSFFSEDADSSVKDAGIIADAQRVEHYEISGYGTAHQFAEGLNHSEIANLLQKTLDEESSADKKLNKLAKSIINEEAKKNNA